VLHLKGGKERRREGGWKEGEGGREGEKTYIRE
jgi:hypothetical protein